MNKNLLCLLSVVCLLTSIKVYSQSAETESINSFNPERLQRIGQAQEDLIDAKLVGSNQVLIFKDGEIIYDKAVNSGLDGDADITPQTIFPIWSMTKPITTVAVMMLFEEGKFLLDDPIANYLPELDSLQCLDKEGNIYPCKRAVKIRHLLTHQSGWSHYYGTRGDIFYVIDDTEFLDLEDFSKQMAKKPLKFEPGTNYEYSVSTSILGRLIEVISGQSFYAFLKERIFDPLEMPNTKFHLTQEDRKHWQPLLRVNQPESGFFLNKFDELSYKEESKVQIGGGGLVSTTTDYSHFCEMLLNNGIYKNRRIISPTSIKWMHTPLIAESKYGNFKGFSFGFTLFNLTNPILDGGLSPEGIFGWAGYHSTYFWIDQKNNLFGLFMTRRTLPDPKIWRKIRIATYQALN